MLLAYGRTHSQQYPEARCKELPGAAPVGSALMLPPNSGSTRKVKGSHVTQRWSKEDSNRWSHLG